MLSHARPEQVAYGSDLRQNCASQLSTVAVTWDMTSGSYGQAFARRFGAEQAPAFVSAALRKSEVAVTYLQQETPTYAFSDPQPVEDAYLLSMGLRDFPGYSLWE